MAYELKEALEIIKGGDWLQIRCITADLLKGTGGKVIDYPKVRFAKNRNPVAGSAAAMVASQQNEKVKRNPNHHFHFTINLELPNKQVRKVHPILITHVNHQAVL